MTTPEPQPPQPDPHQHQLDLIEAALVSLGASIAEETGAPQPMCTGWVLVTEWSTVDGVPFMARFTDDKLPQWRRDGLLGHALRDWNTDNPFDPRH